MQRYEVIRRIGKGSFGAVDLIRRRTDGKSFVLKRMRVGSVSKKEREMCHNEVQLLERLNHPSIVRYEESFISNKYSESYLCVVMAYCDGGDLTHFLKNQRGKQLKEKHILDLFVQIALGLHFVHQRSILHRDLKAQNIFVKNGQLKIGDFGVSKVLTGTYAFAQTMIGTPYYMSPEVFKGQPYNFKSDIWSLGCVLYELITFRHCFDANNLTSLASKIMKGKYSPIVSGQYRTELKSLVYSMLNQMPSARPTLDSILKHKLLRYRIRDFYILCYKKYKRNVISENTFNNLKSQLYEMGLTQSLGLGNIADIVQKQTLKREQKKKLLQEQQSIEKERKIQKDMETALERLKMERKWRAAKQKQRQRIERNNYNFGLKKVVTINDKRRQAAKLRKLQLLKKQEQKRQALAMKHRNKQESAAKRKNIEMNRKMYGSNIRSPQKLKAKMRSPKRFNNQCFEEQVQQLNAWENAHINKYNSKPKEISVKQHKSSLSLLQQKIKYQKEFDALGALKKRRKLIQQRLNEISDRHKQRQITKQSIFRESQSEQPKHNMRSPYKKPSQLRGNTRIPFMSPNQELNPRQKMQARKRARADLRAKQIKHANSIEYKHNKLQARENKKKTRAVSVGMFEETMDCDDDICEISEISSVSIADCALSEPPINQFGLANAILTIQESDILSHEIEQEMDAEEIDELKETLAEHTKNIEQFKEDILLQRKRNLCDSDSDDEESVADVETLLNAQEQNMKTMRLNQENIEQTPNVICDESKMEQDSYEDSSDEEMPIGRLSDRIEFIKRKCVNAMGLQGFKIAYNLMKEVQFQDQSEFNAVIDQKIKQLCNDSNTPKSRVEKYRSLIDQLLFIEANCS